MACNESALSDNSSSLCGKCRITKKPLASEIFAGLVLILNYFKQRCWNTILLDWLPVILWASAIFFFSTDDFSASHTSQMLTPLLERLVPGISPETIEYVHVVVRKFGHWFEYLVFSALLLRVLLHENDQHPPLRNVLWTLLVIFFYAAGDEFHQSFVPGRTASIYDVMIDFCGGLCGTLGTFLYYTRTNRWSFPPQASALDSARSIRETLKNLTSKG